MQLDGIEDRIVRITPNSSEIADAIVDADGESLYYLSAFEEGYDLWKLDLRKKSTECLKKLDTSSAQFDVQKDGKCIFILGARIMQKLTVASDKMERISYKAEMKMDWPRNANICLTTFADRRHAISTALTCTAWTGR